MNQSTEFLSDEQGPHFHRLPDGLSTQPTLDKHRDHPNSDDPVSEKHFRRWPLPEYFESLAGNITLLSGGHWNVVGHAVATPGDIIAGL